MCGDLDRFWRDYFVFYFSLMKTATFWKANQTFPFPMVIFKILAFKKNLPEELFFPRLYPSIYSSPWVFSFWWQCVYLDRIFDRGNTCLNAASLSLPPSQLSSPLALLLCSE